MVRSLNAFDSSRAAEAKLAALRSSATSLVALNEKARWEVRTHAMAKSRRINSAVSNLIEKSNDMESRRTKLAALLADESESLIQELKSSLETPQQRLDMMRAKAQSLKDAREAERKAKADAKLYEKWRASQDELRELDSQVAALQVAVDNDDQVALVKKRQEMEARDSEILESIMQERFRLEAEREERKEVERLAKEHMIKAVLDSQVAAKRKTEARRAQDAMQEATLTVQRMAKLEEAENARALEERLRLELERQKMKTWLETAKRQRELEKADLVAADREYVQSVISREKRAAAEEAAEREKYIRQMREFNEAMKKDMERQAESFIELERVQAQEQERQWQKKFAIWEKEDRARQQLLAEVYSERNAQVAEKKQLREEKIKGLEQERAEHLLSIQEAEEQYLAEQETRAERTRKYLAGLGEQLKTKDRLQSEAAEKEFAKMEKEQQEQNHFQAALNLEKQRRVAKAAELAKQRRAVVAPWDKSE